MKSVLETELFGADDDDDDDDDDSEPDENDADADLLHKLTKPKPPPPPPPQQQTPRRSPRNASKSADNASPSQRMRAAQQEPRATNPHWYQDSASTRFDDAISLSGQVKPAARTTTAARSKTSSKRSKTTK